MKSISELSKTELENLIMNNWLSHFSIEDKVVDCAVCGNRTAKYSYICDKCNKKLEGGEDLEDFI